MIAALFIGVFLSAVLGGFSAGGLQALLDLAPEFARQIDSRVSPSTNLLIVRKVGDEASLALSAGQLFSWATMRAFDHLAAEDAKPWYGNPFTGRWLPKSVWALWLLAVVVTVICIGWSIGWAIHEGGPIDPPVPLLVKLTIGAATLATLLIKSTLFQRYLFGLVFLGLAAAMSPKDADPRWWVRWIGGVFIATMIETHAEVSPPGRWVIRYFEHTEADRRADNKSLVHSAYDDPRVVDELI